MTLTRQLISTISALCLLALVGIEVIHLRSAQRHQQLQLESLAQDTATSIGLSLGALLRSGDVALAETVINPVFDRGHYARIAFVSTGGEPLVTKTLRESATRRYPLWFARFFELHPPQAESLVTAGWRQLGRVQVEVYPRFAYEQLWTTASDTLLYLLLIYALMLGALRLFLRGVLGPLHAIERAAISISGRDFVSIPVRPATRELARVVEAMNALSQRVNAAIRAEAERADAFQRRATVDEVSGLLNRRGLHEQFDAAYRQDREGFVGAFGLAEIDALGEINETLGQARCDALIGALGTAIADLVQPMHGQAARWGGASFALVLPRLDAATARERLGELQAQLALILSEFGVDAPARITIGAHTGDWPRTELEDLVALAQSQLIEARERSDTGLAVRERVEDRSTPSSEAIVIQVRNAIAARRLVLVGQRVLDLPERNLLHTEIMARIAGPEGRLIPAGAFLSIVSQYGLARDLDEAVLDQICALALELRDSQSVSMNLSARSLGYDGFIDWLVRRFGMARASSVRFVLELSESGVVQAESAALDLASALRDAGVGFAIDHFGVHRNSIALLQRLKPDYVKLAALHTPRLGTDEGTRFFVDSLARAARQLDIGVIAQNVEQAALVDQLGLLGFAGYQGHVTGEPTLWPLVREG